MRSLKNSAGTRTIVTARQIQHNNPVSRAAVGLLRLTAHKTPRIIHARDRPRRSSGSRARDAATSRWPATICTRCSARRRQQMVRRADQSTREEGIKTMPQHTPRKAFVQLLLGLTRERPSPRRSRRPRPNLWAEPSSHARHRGSATAQPRPSCAIESSSPLFLPDPVDAAGFPSHLVRGSSGLTRGADRECQNRVILWLVSRGTSCLKPH